MGRLAVLSLLLLPFLLDLPAADAQSSDGFAWRGPYRHHIDEENRADEDDRIDWKALWPYWFEHEREAWLAGRLHERRREMWYPLTAELREKVVRPLLVRCLSQPESEVREAAALALGRLGGEAAIVPLTHRVQEDRDARVREASMLAIGLLRHRDSVGILLTEVDRQPSWTNAMAALALGLTKPGAAREALLARFLRRKKEKGRKSTDGRWREVDACTAVALGVHGRPEDVPELLRRLPGRKREILRSQLCQALGRIGGDDACRWLLRTADDGSPAVSASAVRALANFPEPRVVQALLTSDGIRSGNTLQRVAAIHSLLSIAPGLSPALRRRVIGEIRERARKPQRNLFDAMHGTLGLGRFGDAEVLVGQDRLFHASRSGLWRSEARTALFMACGFLRQKGAGKTLAAVLQDPSEPAEVRGYAALALGLMGDPECAKTLRRVLLKGQRPEAAVARGCCRALGLIGGDEDLDSLVIMLLRYRERDVKGAAAIAIARIGGRPAMERLVGIVAEGTQSPNTRAAALHALGVMVAPETAPRLARLLQGLNYRLVSPSIVRAWRYP